MRKSLVRLLAVVLMFRFSWIAAAAGCMHEADATQRHFGHHVHVHKLSKSDGLDKKAKAGGADNDCAVCHAGCGNAPGTHVALSVGGPHRDHPSSVQQLHPTGRSDTPDRPRWARLA